MKVLDLQCQHAHSFEGWFGSEGDFQSQLARGLVQCPLCGDAHITKMLSAPRLNLSGVRDAPSAAAAETPATPSPSNPSRSVVVAEQGAAASHDANIQTMAQDPQFQAAYLHMARKIIANTEDVGTQFAEEARKMHYGEASERAIRGQATQDEALELLDEGIDVMALHLPLALKEPLQ
jgi:hypothetical protein